MTGGIWLTTVMVVVPENAQISAVAVTVYVLVRLGLAVTTAPVSGVVPPVQVYDIAPLTDKVAVCPIQMVLAEIFRDRIVIVAVLLEKQPFDDDPLTV
jgi:hypothetical protein